MPTSTRAFSIALMGTFAAASHAVTFQDESGNKYELAGFAKAEWGMAGEAPRLVPDNLSAYTFDNRNALSKPAASQTTRGSKSSELSMQQVNPGWSRETDAAIGLEARVAYRWRSGESATDVFKSPDVD